MEIPNNRVNSLIKILSTSEIFIENCIMKYSIIGILLKGTNNISINNNQVFNHESAGIIFEGSAELMIYGNSINYNGKGVFGDNITNGVCFNNTFISNIGYSIELLDSVNINIYENFFFYNNNSTGRYNTNNCQAYDDSINNCWFNRNNSIGNYWRDWDSGDKNKDGICDKPYVPSGNNGVGDLYPQFLGEYDEDEYNIDINRIIFVVLFVISAILISIFIMNIILIFRKEHPLMKSER